MAQRRRLSHSLFFITGTAFMVDAICGALVYAIAKYPNAVPGFPGRGLLEIMSEKITEQPLYAAPLMVMNGVCVIVGAGLVIYGIYRKKGGYNPIFRITPVLGIITALFRPFTPYLGQAGSMTWAWLSALKATVITACLLAASAASEVRYTSKRKSTE